MQREPIIQVKNKLGRCLTPSKMFLIHFFFPKAFDTGSEKRSGTEECSVSGHLQRTAN